MSNEADGKAECMRGSWIQAGEDAGPFMWVFFFPSHIQIPQDVQNPTATAPFKQFNNNKYRCT